MRLVESREMHLDEGDGMANKRYKSKIALSKSEKVNLMSEYIDYYERLINEQGIKNHEKMPSYLEINDE